MMKSVRKVGSVLVCVSIIVISLMFTGISYAVIDPKACVGMWLFDEGAGDVAKDSSGKGNDGAIKDAEWTDDSKFGKALEFDRAAASLVSISLDVIDLSKDQSFCAWFKTDLVENIHAQVLHADFADNYRFWMWIMRSGHGAGGKLGFGYRNGGQVGLEMTSVDKLNDGAWHHAVGVFDHTANEGVLYVDGARAAAKSIADFTFNASQGDLCVGGNCGGSAGSLWQGEIDEVAVFNVALKEEDVQAIMNQGLEEALGVVTAVYPAGKLTATWGDIKAQ